MAASRAEDQPPHTRADNLQKMLDLEKRCKLARIYNVHTLSGTDPSISLPSEAQSSKRRDSRERPARYNARHHPSVKSVPRTTFQSHFLTITIPASETVEDHTHHVHHTNHAREESGDRSMSTIDRRTSHQKGSSNEATRPARVSFLPNEKGGSDDEDNRSEHSSICQSPSWEGYGRQKKSKKADSDHRKKDGDKSKHEKAPEKKGPNRLSKFSPSQKTNQRPPNSFATRYEKMLKSSIARTSVDEPPMQRRIVLKDTPMPAAGSVPGSERTRPVSTQIGTASTTVANNTRPRIVHISGVRSMSEPTPKTVPADKAKPANAAPPTTAPLTTTPLTTTPLTTTFMTTPLTTTPLTTTPLMTTPLTKTPLTKTPLTKTPLTKTPLTKTPLTTTPPTAKKPAHHAPAAPMSMKTSYPPLSSRSRNLNMAGPPNHVRRNSASAIASNFFRSKNGKVPSGSVSDQENGSNIANRGRQGDKTAGNGNGNNNSSSYVLRVRAQSIERSITGFIEQTALSFSNRVPNQGSKSRSASRDSTTGRESTDTTTNTFTSVSRPTLTTSSDMTVPAGGMLSSIKYHMRRRNSSSSSTAPMPMRSLSKGANAGAAGWHSSVQALQTTLSQATTFEKAQPDAQKDVAVLLPGKRPGFGVRAFEASSASSYRGDSSVPPSPAITNTPDTSRPQSTKGLAASTEDIRAPEPAGSKPLLAQLSGSGVLSGGAAKAESDTPQPMRGPPERAVVGSASSAGHSGEASKPISRSRFVERMDQLEEEVKLLGKGRGSSGKMLGQSLDGHDSGGESESDSRTTLDADAQSFVTTLSKQESWTETIHGVPAAVTQAAVTLEKAQGNQRDEPVVKAQHLQPQHLQPPRGSGASVKSVSNLLPPPLVSSSGHSSSSATYLQEARQSAPTVSSPLANVIQTAKASLSAPVLEGSEAEKLSKPLAKVLVQCCHCKFFHDMPSRVYECMAQPNAVVTDRNLGVSGAITTMVKCPWCAHNMSKKCCAGYAAVVYLKERLH